MITITFSYQSYNEDLTIPNYWTVARLLEELAIIFNFVIPNNYRLAIQNKYLLLSPDDQLNHYPVSQGDIFELLEV